MLWKVPTSTKHNKSVFIIFFIKGKDIWLRPWILMLLHEISFMLPWHVKVWIKIPSTKRNKNPKTKKEKQKGKGKENVSYWLDFVSQLLTLLSSSGIIVQLSSSVSWCSNLTPSLSFLIGWLGKGLCWSKQVTWAWSEDGTLPSKSLFVS